MKMMKTLAAVGFAFSTLAIAMGSAQAATDLDDLEVLAVEVIDSSDTHNDVNQGSHENASHELSTLETDVDHERDDNEQVDSSDDHDASSEDSELASEDHDNAFDTGDQENSGDSDVVDDIAELTHDAAEDVSDNLDSAHDAAEDIADAVDSAHDDAESDMPSSNDHG